MVLGGTGGTSGLGRGALLVKEKVVVCPVGVPVFAAIRPLDPYTAGLTPGTAERVLVPMNETLGVFVDSTGGAGSVSVLVRSPGVPINDTSGVSTPLVVDIPSILRIFWTDTCPDI
jgi:hypothetical protein